jgi:hypothetical protein
MRESLRPVAKAVVALLVPFALALIARAAEWVGVDAPDPSLVETLVTAAVSALIVYAVPNTP